MASDWLLSFQNESLSKHRFLSVLIGEYFALELLPLRAGKINQLGKQCLKLLLK